MRLFPSMAVLFDAACGAGALGVYLSGAGSTVAAFVEGPPEAAWPVARAMAQAAARDGLGGRPLVTTTRADGATIMD
jgi:homoserine kinase